MERVIYPSRTGVVPSSSFTLRQDVEHTWLAEQWVLVNLTFWMRQSE